jgi:hypothetical protein
LVALNELLGQALVAEQDHAPLGKVEGNEGARQPVCNKHVEINHGPNWQDHGHPVQPVWKRHA